MTMIRKKQTFKKASIPIGKALNY